MGRAGARLLPVPGSRLVAADSDGGAADAVGALFEADEAVRALGISIVDVAPGTVELAFTPSTDAGNGHGIVHGGYLFLLADTALAYAFASRGQSGVTMNASIDFLAPARVNTRLTARASEFHRMGAAGIYDVTLKDAEGRTVAVFRGHARIPRATSASHP
jgi:acyl-CoA thioesterase